MKKLNIALVAHDARKQELIEWCKHNAAWLNRHTLYGTGTTAKLLNQIMVPVYRLDGSVAPDCEALPLSVKPLLSGPLGGDSEISTMIAHGEIDVLIFFCDNLITQGHQQDVGALSRLASLYNIAFATNRTTADLIVTSPLLVDNSYTRVIPPVIERYRNRFAVS
jgi:methylglyoxal synthase